MDCRKHIYHLSFLHPETFSLFRYPGIKIQKGDPLYSYWSPTDLQIKVKRHDSKEGGIVDKVLLVGDRHNAEKITFARIKLRIDRRPTWGDKFSSRHGQKGTLSQLFPQQDMPYTESGIVPDLIINPHAFPSRMTIGMLMESMAGKSGAMHGIYQEGSPFCFLDSEKTAQEVFGEELVKAGYNYFGNEPMYSGITGTEFRSDIFIGVVAYQRLRHMVNDKWQYRALGQNDWLTHQPVKGRARGGGLRLGEMERDAIISHGAAFLLTERFMQSSDERPVFVCDTCHRFVGTYVEQYWAARKHAQTVSPRHCTFCEHALPPKESNLRVINIPHAFLYLATELFGMGVHLGINFK